METLRKLAGITLAGLMLAGSPAQAAPRIISPPLHFDPVSAVCISHRGNSEYQAHTEETVEQYRSSIGSGSAEDEGDIRWTRTGYPMLLHDSTLGKFGAPTLKLADLSVGQAQSHESPSGDMPSTLYQLRVLAKSYPGHRWELELKENVPDWDVLNSRLGDLKPVVTLSSFSPARVRQAQDQGYRTVLLSADDTSVTLAPVVAQDFSTIDAAHVAALASVGVETYAYTPDSESAWDAVLNAGVKRIITNKPHACSDYVKGR